MYAFAISMSGASVFLLLLLSSLLARGIDWCAWHPWFSSLSKVLTEMEVPGGQVLQALSQIPSTHYSQKSLKLYWFTKPLFHASAALETIGDNSCIGDYSLRQPATAESPSFTIRAHEQSENGTAQPSEWKN